MMEIRECNGCDWVGWADDCVHPKHVQSLSLCPECKETTFTVTSERVIELREMIQKAFNEFNDTGYLSTKLCIEAASLLSAEDS